MISVAVGTVGDWFRSCYVHFLKSKKSDNVMLLGAGLAWLGKTNFFDLMFCSIATVRCNSQPVDSVGLTSD